jgi:hypothetical protein
LYQIIRLSLLFQQSYNRGGVWKIKVDNKDIGNFSTHINSQKQSDLLAYVGVDVLSQPLGVEYGLALSCPINSITTVCFVSDNPLII